MDSIAGRGDTLEPGTRVGFIDGDEISLGTIRTVEPGYGSSEYIIRITWDDGFDDTEDDGRWDWPQENLKRIR